LGERIRPAWTVLRHAVQDFGDDECGLRAAALSYHALLSFFPLLLFLIFIAGITIESSNSQQALIMLAERAIPELAGPAANLIRQTVAARASFGILGGLGLLWSASALFTVLTSTFSVIWEAPLRPIWRRRLIGLVSVLALGILFIFSLLTRALSAFDVAEFARIDRRWVNLGVDLGVTTMLTWVLYTWLPNRKIDWRMSLGGAVLAALLWQVAKLGFSSYLAFGLERLGAIYGSLGSVIVLVLWVYFSSVILFFGAEFAAALQTSDA
jgi:membrane protein